MDGGYGNYVGEIGQDIFVTGEKKVTHRIGHPDGKHKGQLGIRQRVGLTGVG